MKHLLEISQLSCDDVKHLLARAQFFKQNSVQDYPQYPHQTMANLFYECSTRTRISFEMAAKHLGMHVVNVDIERSSESKGEMLEDTILTLFSMGIKTFVLRHQKNGCPKAIVSALPSGLHIINAGDGAHEHPSQALLDLLTITEYKPNLDALKIVVVGDLLHSRVANSLQHLCALMGVSDLVLVAPEQWYPRTLIYGRLTSSLSEALHNADVVMTLRIQNERLQSGEFLDINHYRQQYAITQKTIAWAKPDVMVMHPGPVNRGIELDSDVADGPRSSILEQVKNGVYMRMAILDTILSKTL